MIYGDISFILFAKLFNLILHLTVNLSKWLLQCLSRAAVNATESPPKLNGCKALECPIQSYDCKGTPIGPLYAEKIRQRLLLHVFLIELPASVMS